MSRETSLAALKHRALIAIEGDEAEHFLEGLVTSQLPGPGEVVGSALLTPQGKILFTFLLARTNSGFALECDGEEVKPLVQRLTLYKLRAKVTITPADFPVSAGTGPGLVDTRHPDLGVRVYGSADATESVDDYHAKRQELGVLEGPQEILAGQDFPHDVALDLTNAVSFTKGCFVGQEVVSRVKHRGTARRRPVLVAGQGLEPGQAVISGEREIGTIRSASSDRAIAVVRLDHIKQDVSVDGKPVTLAPPPYATYSLDGD